MTQQQQQQLQQCHQPVPAQQTKEYTTWASQGKPLPTMTAIRQSSRSTARPDGATQPLRVVMNHAVHAPIAHGPEGEAASEPDEHRIMSATPHELGATNHGTGHVKRNTKETNQQHITNHIHSTHALPHPNLNTKKTKEIRTNARHWLRVRVACSSKATTITCRRRAPQADNQAPNR
jgi:hypothetical protein